MNEKMKTLNLISRIQAFSQFDIMEMIPSETLIAIKASDPHPYFQAYSICHEGVSFPKVLGKEPKPIRWTRKAVESIQALALKGLKFFVGHNADNSTEGRRVIGETVADKQIEIGGRLHHVVVAYVKPEDVEEAKKYDACSQEAEWNLIEKAKGWFADTVDKITGIALTLSGKESPAFEGAKRLAMVQAFKYRIQGEKEMPEEKKPTFSELKQLIKDMNVHPSQLYSLEDLQKDNVFIPTFNKLTDLEKAVKEKEDKIKQLEDGNKNLAKLQLKLNVKERFENLLKADDLKITDKQKAYVVKRFNTDMDDLSDEALKTFINKQVEDYKVNAEFFGAKETEDKKPGNPGGSEEIKPIGENKNPYIDYDLKALEE